MSEKRIPDSDVPNLHNLNAGWSIRSVLYWINDYFNIIPILYNYLTEIKLPFKEKRLSYVLSLHMYCTILSLLLNLKQN